MSDHGALHFCETIEDGWRTCPAALCEADRLLTERDELQQELVRAERRQKVYLDLNAGMREALRDLHAEVEMAESVGICLPDRVPSLRAGQVLAGEGGPAAEEDAQ